MGDGDEVEQALQSARSTTTVRLDPVRGAGWTASCQNIAVLPYKPAGSLFNKMADGQEGSHMICPHCKQAATVVHVIWLCPETQKHFPSMDAEDKQEIEECINLDFLSQGLFELPRYEISTGGAAVQAWGSWTTQDEARLHRHFAYQCVALVHRTRIDGELYRKGAVTTVLPGKQLLGRAWFYGLRLIACVDLSRQIMVQVLSTRT